MIDYWKRYKVQSEVLNLNKKEVAQAIGMRYESFVNYQSTDRIPKTEEAVKIARVLGVSVEWMVTGTEPSVEDMSYKTLNTAVARIIQNMASDNDSVLSAVRTNQSLRKLVKYYIEAGQTRLNATLISLGIDTNEELTSQPNEQERVS